MSTTIPIQPSIFPTNYQSDSSVISQPTTEIFNLNGLQDNQVQKINQPKFCRELIASLNKFPPSISWAIKFSSPEAKFPTPKSPKMDRFVSVLRIKDQYHIPWRVNFNRYARNIHSYLWVGSSYFSLRPQANFICTGYGAIELHNKPYSFI